MPERDAKAQDCGTRVMNVLIELFYPEADFRAAVRVLWLKPRIRKPVLEVLEDDIRLWYDVLAIDQSRHDRAPVEFSIPVFLVLAGPQHNMPILPFKFLLRQADADLLCAERHIVVIEREHRFLDFSVPKADASNGPRYRQRDSICGSQSGRRLNASTSSLCASREVARLRERWGHLLLERHGGEGAVDLVRRPKGDGPRRDAPRGDIGALAGPVEDPRPRRVGHPHGAFDQEHAERLIVDRPAPELGPPDPDGRDRSRHADVGALKLRHLAGEKPEGAKHPELERPPSRSRIENVSIERQLRVLAQRQPRIVLEGNFQPPCCSGRHGLVEKDGCIEAERPCDAATRPARLSLYAA